MGTVKRIADARENPSDFYLKILYINIYIYYVYLYIFYIYLYTPTQTVGEVK